MRSGFDGCWQNEWVHARSEEIDYIGSYVLGYYAYHWVVLIMAVPYPAMFIHHALVSLTALCFIKVCPPCTMRDSVMLRREADWHIAWFGA